MVIANLRDNFLVSSFFLTLALLSWRERKEKATTMRTRRLIWLSLIKNFQLI